MCSATNNRGNLIHRWVCSGTPQHFADPMCRQLVLIFLVEHKRLPCNAINVSPNPPRQSISCWIEMYS